MAFDMQLPGPKLKRGTLLKRRRKTPGIEQQQRHHFLGDHHRIDERTGQVYSEFTVDIQSHDDRGWTRQAENFIEVSDRHSRLALYGGSNPSDAALAEYQNYLDGVKTTTRVQGVFGSRTLRDISIDCILENISDVTHEGIECLPVSLVRHLWHAVNTRHLLSFDTWLMFSKFLSNDQNPTPNILRFRKYIGTPLSPLSAYTKPLTSPTFDFITSLSLNKTFDVPDLVRISSIKNLGVLEIINTPKKIPMGAIAASSPVNDRVIRAWYQAAQNEGAFRVLRILKLWYCEDVTAISLPNLLRFPILAIVDLRGCGLGRSTCSEAKALGWKPTIESNILAVLELSCFQRMQLLKPDTPVLRLVAPQIPEDSPTLKVLRSQVHHFLARPKAEMMELQKLSHYERRDLQDRGNTAVDYNLSDKTRQKPRETASQGSPSYAADKYWDFDNYSTFSAIGELRNDTDLAAAGLDVTEQVILAGSNVVCPIPIMSLKLGFNIASEHPESKWTGGSAFGFIRLQIPTPKVGRNSNHTHFTDDESRPEAISKPKRRKTQIKESKKQSMTDLLGSFY